MVKGSPETLLRNPDLSGIDPICQGLIWENTLKVIIVVVVIADAVDIATNWLSTTWNQSDPSLTQLRATVAFWSAE